MNSTKTKTVFRGCDEQQKFTFFYVRSGPVELTHILLLQYAYLSDLLSIYTNIYKANS